MNSAALLRLFAVLLFALASFPAFAFSSLSDAQDQFSDASEQFRLEGTPVTEALADGDMAGATTHANTARGYLVNEIGLINQAISEFLVDPKSVSKALKGLNTALVNLDKAIQVFGDPLSTKAQAVLAFQQATASEGVGSGLFLNASKTAPRLSLVAGKPDLYKPGAAVCWKIMGLPASYKSYQPWQCPIHISFSNPALGLDIKAISSTPEIQPFNPCSGQFCFRMDQDMGGGQVSVNDSDTGNTASRIVFNYGGGRVYPGTGKPLATLTGLAQFAGSYSGSYSGVFTISESCGGGTRPVSGPVGATIAAGGAITVFAPGDGAGKISPLGTYASGGVGLGDGTASFRGGVINSRINNSAVASGGWTSKQSCGTGAGTWSAARN